MLGQDHQTKQETNDNGEDTQTQQPVILYHTQHQNFTQSRSASRSQNRSNRLTGQRSNSNTDQTTFNLNQQSLHPNPAVAAGAESMNFKNNLNLNDNLKMNQQSLHKNGAKNRHDSHSSIAAYEKAYQNNNNLTTTDNINDEQRTQNTQNTLPAAYTDLHLHSDSKSSSQERMRQHGYHEEEDLTLQVDSVGEIQARGRKSGKLHQMSCPNPQLARRQNNPQNRQKRASLRYRGEGSRKSRPNSETCSEILSSEKAGKRSRSSTIGSPVMVTRLSPKRIAVKNLNQNAANNQNISNTKNHPQSESLKARERKRYNSQQQSGTTSALLSRRGAKRQEILGTLSSEGKRPISKMALRNSRHQTGQSNNGGGINVTRRSRRQRCAEKDPADFLPEKKVINVTSVVVKSSANSRVLAAKNQSMLRERSHFGGNNSASLAGGSRIMMRSSGPMSRNSDKITKNYGKLNQKSQNQLQGSFIGYRSQIRPKRENQQINSLRRIPVQSRMGGAISATKRSKSDAKIVKKQKEQEIDEFSESNYERQIANIGLSSSQKNLKQKNAQYGQKLMDMHEKEVKNLKGQIQYLKERQYHDKIKIDQLKRRNENQTTKLKQVENALSKEIQSNRSAQGLNSELSNRVTSVDHMMQKFKQELQSVKAEKSKELGKIRQELKSQRLFVQKKDGQIKLLAGQAMEQIKLTLNRFEADMTEMLNHDGDLQSIASDEMTAQKYELIQLLLVSLNSHEQILKSLGGESDVFSDHNTSSRFDLPISHNSNSMHLYSSSFQQKATGRVSKAQRSSTSRSRSKNQSQRRTDQNSTPACTGEQNDLSQTGQNFLNNSQLRYNSNVSAGGAMVGSGQRPLSKQDLQMQSVLNQQARNAHNISQISQNEQNNQHLAVFGLQNPQSYGPTNGMVVKNETQQSAEAIIVDNNSVDMFADKTLSNVKSDALQETRIQIAKDMPDTEATGHQIIHILNAQNQPNHLINQSSTDVGNMSNQDAVRTGDSELHAHFTNQSNLVLPGEQSVQNLNQIDSRNHLTNGAVSSEIQEMRQEIQALKDHIWQVEQEKTAHIKDERSRGSFNNGQNNNLLNQYQSKSESQIDANQMTTMGQVEAATPLNHNFIQERRPRRKKKRSVSRKSRQNSSSHHYYPGAPHQLYSSSQNYQNGYDSNGYPLQNEAQNFLKFQQSSSEMHEDQQNSSQIQKEYSTEQIEAQHNPHLQSSNRYLHQDSIHMAKQAVSPQNQQDSRFEIQPASVKDSQPKTQRHKSKSKSRAPFENMELGILSNPVSYGRSPPNMAYGNDTAPAQSGQQINFGLKLLSDQREDIESDNLTPSLHGANHHNQDSNPLSQGSTLSIAQLSAQQQVLIQQLSQGIKSPQIQGVHNDASGQIFLNQQQASNFTLNKQGGADRFHDSRSRGQGALSKSNGENNSCLSGDKQSKSTSQNNQLQNSQSHHANKASQFQPFDQSDKIVVVASLEEAKKRGMQNILSHEALMTQTQQEKHSMICVDGGLDRQKPVHQTILSQQQEITTTQMSPDENTNNTADIVENQQVMSRQMMVMSDDRTSVSSSAIDTNADIDHQNQNQDQDQRMIMNMLSSSSPPDANCVDGNSKKMQEEELLDSQQYNFREIKVSSKDQFSDEHRSGKRSGVQNNQSLMKKDSYRKALAQKILRETSQNRDNQKGKREIEKENRQENVKSLNRLNQQKATTKVNQQNCEKIKKRQESKSNSQTDTIHNQSASLPILHMSTEDLHLKKSTLTMDNYQEDSNPISRENEPNLTNFGLNPLKQGDLQFLYSANSSAYQTQVNPNMILGSKNTLVKPCSTQVNLTSIYRMAAGVGGGRITPEAATSLNKFGVATGATSFQDYTSQSGNNIGNCGGGTNSQVPISESGVTQSSHVLSERTLNLKKEIGKLDDEILMLQSSLQNALNSQQQKE